MDDLAEKPSDEQLLRSLVEAVEAETGESFFRALVRHLAEALGVAYTFVSELTRGGTHFRSLALWARGEPGRDFEVPLDGTPCEAVLKGSIAFHRDSLQELFPRDEVLREWGVVSYGGVPMPDSTGKVVGHVAFLHDRPLQDQTRALSIMRIFARRAVAELERQRAEQALRLAERRLAAIVDRATDAILSFDEEGLIRVFNAAAARVLRCPVEEALGTPVERFVTDEWRTALEAVVKHSERDPDAAYFVDEDDGIRPRRADGTLFLHEGSMSRSEVGGRVLYTCIFRDVEERRRGSQELKSLRQQTEYLREELASLHPFEEIVGRSPALLRTLGDLELVARTDSTVLIGGETGTGKELVARAIHARSRRSERPLVKVNCAAIPAGLVESELFGHEKGAFTGANERRIGRFELAQGGTLFLDEVGDLPPEAQVKLLRVLQEREFERVGGQRTLRVDVRVLAATNRDLQKAMAEGRFRQDLYYRLNVFPLAVPPLRERLGDIPILAHYFLSRHAPRVGRRISRISPASLESLVAYPWPGNVRELENVIERALILGRGPELEVPPQLLGLALLGTSAPAHPEVPAPPGAAPSETSLEEVARDHILATLRATGWRVEGPQGAAQLLGLRPSTLRSRMRKLGIRREANGGS